MKKLVVLAALILAALAADVQAVGFRSRLSVDLDLDLNRRQRVARRVERNLVRSRAVQRFSRVQNVDRAPLVIRQEPIVIEREPLVIEREPLIIEQEPLILRQRTRVRIRDRFLDACPGGVCDIW